MFKKNTYISLTENSSKKPEVPEGLLKKCNACKSAIFAQDVKNADYICPKCHNYFRIHARHRIEMVADEGSFEEWNTDLVTRNPLHYKGFDSWNQSSNRCVRQSVYYGKYGRSCGRKNYAYG